MAHDFFYDEKQEFADLAQNSNANKKRNRKITEERRDFSARIDEAMAPKKDKDDKEYRSKEEKIKCLDAILNEEGFNKRDSTQVMQLFSSYRSLGAYDKMIEVYTKTDNKDFRSAPMVREQLAGAYYQRSFKEGRPAELAEKDRAMATRICDHLINVEKGSSVAYGIAAACLSAEGKQAEATAMYEKGFEATLDPFIGLQAVQANIRNDNKDRAEEMAKVVYLSALRDGAEESKDFYAVSAALQAACIAGVDETKIGHLTSRLARCVQYEWQKDEIERNLKTIEQNGFEAAKTVQQEIGKWKLDENAKSSGLIVIKELGTDDRSFGDDPKLEALHQHSYNYRGCGSDFRGVSRVGGNMEFGGQLPSHTVSRRDLELFTALIQHTPAELGIKNMEGLNPELPLDQIKEPEVFMKAADRLVRQTFMTENFAGRGLHLEDNAVEGKEADGKSAYDKTVAGALEECGKTSDINSIPEKEQWKEKKYVDTRTNISAIFALGMGDCRHHAQVKQIMFDMYQRKQMNDALGKMLSQVRDGQTVDLEKGSEAQAFNDVLNTELRTTDVQVLLPIKMQQEKQENGKWVPAKEGEEGTRDATYKPLLDGKKYTVDESGKLHNLEDHTLCWLIRRDDNGKLAALEMRDAFYQDKHYGWGDKPVDIEKDITLETRKDKDGKDYTALKVRAATIEGKDTSTGKPIEVYQEPTGYNTGRREQEVNSSTGNDVCFVGMQMKGFDSAESFVSMVADRSKMAAVLNKIEHKKRIADKAKEKQAEEKEVVPQTQTKASKTPMMQNLQKQQKQNDTVKLLKNMDARGLE